MTVEQLVDQLNDFSPRARVSGLMELAARVECGEIAAPPTKQEVNLHFHTFFSYNAYGWSPSRIAWEAKKYGLGGGGHSRFRRARRHGGVPLRRGKIIGLKTTAAMETRVLIPEYADKVINSQTSPASAISWPAGASSSPR